jgi:hypothetical protein
MVARGEAVGVVSAGLSLSGLHPYFFQVASTSLDDVHT